MTHARPSRRECRRGSRREDGMRAPELCYLAARARRWRVQSERVLRPRTPRVRRRRAGGAAFARLRFVRSVSELRGARHRVPRVGAGAAGRAANGGGVLSRLLAGRCPCEQTVRRIDGAVAASTAPPRLRLADVGGKLLGQPAQPCVLCLELRQPPGAVTRHHFANGHGLPQATRAG